MLKDVSFYRKEYKKQAKLEKFVNSRILVRPKVKKWQVTACFVTLPFLLASIVYLFIIFKFDLWYRIAYLMAAIVLLVELYLRICLILIVKRYQASAKEETRKRCKCVPSCSEFAILSLKKIFPLLLALLKIRKRLFKTCNGDGYKIDFPTKKMTRKFEKTFLINL